MNMVVFAIELYEVPWDFGTLAFKNIVMVIDCLECCSLQVANNGNTAFCDDRPYVLGGTNWTMSGVSKTVEDGIVTCRIKELTFLNAT